MNDQIQALLDKIHVADAREFWKDLPANSVDLIYTDPVYEKIEDYRWLAELGTRVLRPNSACLVHCAIGLLPEVHDALRAGGLTYHWRLVVRHVRSKEFAGRLLICTKEILWYEKGNSQPRESIFDLQDSVRKGSYLVGGKNWGKSVEDTTLRYVATFSPPGGIVLDPFAGGGAIPQACAMLGRHFLATEIVPEVAARAQSEIDRIFAFGIANWPTHQVENEQCRMEDLEAT